MDRGARARTLLLALAALTALTAVWLPPADPAAASNLDEPPPFQVRHFDLVDLPFDRLPWTGDLPPELPAEPPVDRNGIRLFRWNDGRLYYRPGSVAINGMKRIDAWRDTGDRAQLEQALVHARHLRGMRIVRDDAWWLPFWFDYPPEALEAPWFNAMSQGLVLSFFVRLHRVTGDDLHLRAAQRVFASFRRLGPWDPEARRGGWARARASGGATAPRPWVAYVDDRDYLWLEHYPTADPDHVLNAHLHSVIGLYEYWQHTRDPEARQLLEGSLTTMRDRGQQYRRKGRVSVYGLRSRTNHYRYHEVHVWQFRLLGRMTGDPFFTELGDLMAADRAPRWDVPGRPVETRSGPALSRARRTLQHAHYPPVLPYLRRAG